VPPSFRIFLLHVVKRHVPVPPATANNHTDSPNVSHSTSPKLPLRALDSPSTYCDFDIAASFSLLLHRLLSFRVCLLCCLLYSVNSSRKRWSSPWCRRCPQCAASPPNRDNELKECVCFPGLLLLPSHRTPLLHFGLDPCCHRPAFRNPVVLLLRALALDSGQSFILICCSAHGSSKQHVRACPSLAAEEARRACLCLLCLIPPRRGSYFSSRIKSTHLGRILIDKL
jgi:hypothetical protein